MSPAAEVEAPVARRPKRADGRRNYDAILQAARTAFAGRGTGASLEDIAKSAGVAIGTLYGHFPTRETLVEASVREQLDQLEQAAATLAEEREALPALTSWMRLAVEHCSTYRGLASFLAGSAHSPGAPLHRSSATMHAAAAPLLAGAKAAGHIADGVSTDELYQVITAAAWVRENSPADVDHSVRLLEFLTAGMAPGARIGG
ncbi:TetR/AcrR family transcriptional regulator [Actinokineospora pegani]|uniref:TetR/AcrR family transcriptional regulator n=1 Tax=Actinokineospora pegani TaxID=2654637 RepID=UPI001F348D41|nr:TetR/AcrR family transcriptional regulator [Actinokineospora pegani]